MRKQTWRCFAQRIAWFAMVVAALVVSGGFFFGDAALTTKAPAFQPGLFLCLPSLPTRRGGSALRRAQGCGTRGGDIPAAAAVAEFLPGPAAAMAAPAPGRKPRYRRCPPEYLDQRVPHP